MDWRICAGVGFVLQVDELMGNMEIAATSYEKAAALLDFLVIEAATLPIVPPLLLSDTDRNRIRGYAHVVTARHRQCIAMA